MVYPTGMPNPARIPTLGLRPIIRNGLLLTIDGSQKQVTISVGP